MASAQESLPVELKFSGEMYQGVMPARELSEVLDGFDRFARALSVASGADEIEVKVQAFSEGSFDIPLLLDLAGKAGLGAILWSIVTAWWKVAFRRVANARHDAETEVVGVTFTDGGYVEIPEAAWRLLNDREAKRAMRKITGPLRRGADELVITGLEAEPRSILPADAVSMDDDPEPIAPSIFTTTATVDTLRFKSAKFWRLDTDMGTIGATIEDEAFLTSLKRGTRVGENDVFTVRMRAETDPDQGHTKYFVEQVMKHDPGPEQEILPDAD